MRHAFITMRESLNSYGEIIESIEECYFDKNKKDFDVFPLSFNTPLSEIDFNNCSLIILTGGGTVPNKYRSDKTEEYQQSHRDLLEEELIKIAIEKNIPLFCICRGAQFVNGFFGGKTQRIPFEHKPSIPHPVVSSNGNSFVVNSFHNDYIEKGQLAKCFEPLAYDKSERIVECFSSNQYRILAVQWHPERSGNDPKATAFIRESIKKVMGK